MTAKNWREDGVAVIGTVFVHTPAAIAIGSVNEKIVGGLDRVTVSNRMLSQEEPLRATMTGVALKSIFLRERPESEIETPMVESGRPVLQFVASMIKLERDTLGPVNARMVQDRTDGLAKGVKILADWVPRTEIATLGW